MRESIYVDGVRQKAEPCQITSSYDVIVIIITIVFIPIRRPWASPTSSNIIYTVIKILRSRAFSLSSVWLREKGRIRQTAKKDKILSKWENGLHEERNRKGRKKEGTREIPERVSLNEWANWGDRWIKERGEERQESKAEGMGEEKKRGRERDTLSLSIFHSSSPSASLLSHSLPAPLSLFTPLKPCSSLSSSSPLPPPPPFLSFSSLD